MLATAILVFISHLCVPVFGSHVLRQTSSNSSSLTGGSVCTSLLCITATVNSSDVEYVLQSTGSSSLGWVAMGFGSQMANSPMVILWPNQDGTVTLSQRIASRQVMPTVQASPPRVASLQLSSTSLTGSKPQLAFTIPKNSDTIQNIIWAFGTVNPGSSAVDAVLVQHSGSGSGPTTIDLTGSLSSSGVPTSTSGTTRAVPLSQYDRLIVAHAVLCVTGFLLLLPLGALSGRYLRTFTNIWLKIHWAIQALIAGPIIVIGFAFGVSAVNNHKALHFDDTHKKCGISLFVLYLAQCILGIVIHKFKPASAIKRRPFQNYGHAILGILIIALSFFQIHSGYKYEWDLKTGQNALPNAANVVWILFVVLFLTLYGIGLIFLRRQFRQEREYREKDLIDLSRRS